MKLSRLSTKLSTKGQVIIPKNIRHQYQWNSGQELTIVATTEGILLRAKKPFITQALDTVAGCLPYKGKPKSLDDMETAIRKGARNSHDRR